MSNRALLSFLQGGDRLTAFHLGAAGPAGRREGPTHFSGERFEFSAKTHGGDAATDKKDYSKKENREESGPKKKKAKTDDDSGSDSDGDGPHYKSDGIHKKGSDADGDGKTGEGKGKKKDFKKDNNNNGKPDILEKKK